MDESSKKGLLTALFFHFLIIICLLGFLYIPSCSQEKEHVFEIVMPPSQATAQEDIFDESLKTDFIEEKKIPNKKEEVVASTLSYDEFIKKQGVPKVTGKVKKKKIDLPKIKFDDLATDFTFDSEVNSTSPSVSVSQINAYLVQLRGKIDKLWTKPAHLKGNDIFAVVQFSLNKNGDILDARIVQSSNDRHFDTSVLEAIQRLEGAGATPDGRDCTFKLTFRLQQKL